MLKKLKLSAGNWVSNHKKNFHLQREKTSRLTMCKKCFTFYYKNSWHLERPGYLDKDLEVEIPVHFTECLACMEQDQALYDEVESGLVLA